MQHSRTGSRKTNEEIQNKCRKVRKKSGSSLASLCADLQQNLPRRKIKGHNSTLVPTPILFSKNKELNSKGHCKFYFCVKAAAYGWVCICYTMNSNPGLMFRIKKN